MSAIWIKDRKQRVTGGQANSSLSGLDIRVNEAGINPDFRLEAAFEHLLFEEEPAEFSQWHLENTEAMVTT